MDQLLYFGLTGDGRRFALGRRRIGAGCYGFAIINGRFVFGRWSGWFFFNLVKLPGEPQTEVYYFREYRVT